MIESGVESGAEPAQRCAVHPGRPAVDICSVCARSRCAADATRFGPSGCGACTVHAAEGGVRSPGVLERVVRGALAALAAALLGGVVASEYVEADLFAYIAPFVVGVACGAAAQAAAGVRVGPSAQEVRVAAALCAVLGVGLGFLLEGSTDPVSLDAAVPMLFAVAGAIVWTLPPRRRPATGGRGG